MVYSNNFGQTRVGIRNVVVTQVVNAVDADATAFIAAAGITDLTQAAAISTLVNDLKTYGIWSKMKALYPMVGGTATSHKFNLKDPRDLDAAYRLVFNGGWTHGSNGATPNGTTGYADTKLVPSSVISNVNSLSISNYSRTQNTSFSGVQIGCYDGTNGQANELNIYQYYASISRKGGSIYQYSIEAVLSTETNTKGFQLNSRTSSTTFKLFFNNNLLNTNTTLRTGSLPIRSLYIGASNWYNGVNQFSPHEHAFDSIGEGLSDTEAANFYTSVQKFQTTLGRQVGTPYVSDSDAQAFLTAASITDLTQTSAINTLVTDLKTAGVWSKMKALYPFVGGSATSHKWNLKDPRDLDAAYRLVFNGGWTHTSNGALSNGTTGYADTKLAPNIMGLNSQHMSFYVSIEGNTQMGVAVNGYNFIDTFDSSTFRSPINLQNYSLVSATINNRKGFFLGNRNSSTNTSIYKNSSKLNDNFLGSQYLETYPIYISGLNRNPTTNISPSNQYIFASIGDGLTDTEASIFYTALQRYQTTLGRQIDVPLVSDSDAQAFLIAASITSYTQANAVNTLVVDLKSAGVWTKMKALYPFVGGTATSHKWNLKDPRDLDVAYRLTFNGGMSHDSRGIVPNGTTGYANTFIDPYVLSINSGFGYYSQTNNTINSTDIGAISYNMSNPPTYSPVRLFQISNSGTTKSVSISSDVSISYSDTDTRGFYQGWRSDSSTIKSMKDSTILSTSAPYLSSTAYSNGMRYYIGGRYESGIMQTPSSRVLSFSYFQENFNDTDAQNLYTAVQKFQTSLGRQVGTPVYNTNGLVLNLDAGNANSYPGTGTTWFDLASGNNGTLVNGPTYDINNGGSILFDGVNDYVIVSDTPFRFSNKFTISIWFYWDGIDKTNKAILGKRSGPGGNYAQYAIGINNGDVQYGGTGKVLFFYARVDGSVGGNDPLDVIMTYTLPSTPGIYNVSVTMDSNIQKLYINGVLVTSSAKNLVGKTYNISGREFLIGANRDDAGTGALAHFNGKIYSVSVYGRTLIDTEVLQNFNSTRGRFGL
jgi:hypothetical protein